MRAEAVKNEFSPALNTMRYFMAGVDVKSFPQTALDKRTPSAADGRRPHVQTGFCSPTDDPEWRQVNVYRPTHTRRQETRKNASCLFVNYRKNFFFFSAQRFFFVFFLKKKNFPTNKKWFGVVHHCQVPRRLAYQSKVCACELFILVIINELLKESSKHI